MIVQVCNNNYTIEDKVTNLLSILVNIKSVQNSSLAFRSGCKSGVCGSCAVIINNKEQLACKTSIKNGDIVSPLKNMPIIKDLVVDNSSQEKFLKQANAQLQILNKNTVTKQDVIKIDKESNCILCSSCFSSCPVYEVNNNFLGPFALSRVFRYIEDVKELDKKSIINSVQLNGVFDCTLCGNCNIVCPAHIDIKSDIINLQNKSVQYGHSNPNLTNSFNSSLDFSSGGFNPNGF